MSGPGGDITRDAFLGGRLVLDQPARGHRIGTDALILTALARGCLARARLAGRLLHCADFGAGAGLIGLALALLEPDCAVTLAERDPAIAALTEVNQARLPMEIAARCRVLAQDVTNLGKASLPEPARASFDLVAMNPPYLAEGQARLSPSAYRKAAHAGPADTLDAWLRATRRLLKPGGQVALIHRADAITTVLDALATGFGAIAILPVQPRADQDATRILVSAVLNSKAPTVIRPALVLHEAGGAFTSEATALHEGRMTL